MFDKELFHQNLIGEIDALGLSVSQFARSCDMPYSTMNSYLTGKNTPTIKSLLKISNTHTISPNTLLAGMFSPLLSEVNYVGMYRHVLETAKPELRPLIHKISEVQIDFLIAISHKLCNTGLAGRIRAIRTECNYKLNDFATLCAITKSTAKNIEAGTTIPSVELLLSICKNLRVSPEMLLADELSFSSYPLMFRYMTPVQIKNLAGIMTLIQTTLQNNAS